MSPSSQQAVVELPPMSEIYSLKVLADRHPHLLSESRLRWALRNRAKNGLDEVHAVFDSRGGELLIHEPSFLRWFLGLSGRNKPRAGSRKPRGRRSSLLREKRT